MKSQFPTYDKGLIGAHLEECRYTLLDEIKESRKMFEDDKELEHDVKQAILEGLDRENEYFKRHCQIHQGHSSHSGLRNKLEFCSRSVSCTFSG